jgi:predicted nucleic acid-binding Zn ribbon protein
MMPNINREERRKKRAPVIALIVFSSLLVSVLLPASWQWLPIAVGTSAAIAVGVTIDMPGGRGRRSGLRGRRGRSSGLTAHGRDADGPAAVAAHRWHTLVIVSRLMPRQAGRRWLAEAESLLSEIPAFQRDAAIRSYLVSAPRLAVMMWVRESQRRARLGPRRPG